MDIVTETVSRKNVAGACQRVTTSAQALVPISSEASDIRSTLVQGDRIHATPYWRRIVDPVEMKGKLGLNSNTRVTIGICGNEPVETRTGLISPSLWQNKFTSMPLSIDASLDTYLKDASITKALANARRSYNNIPLLIAERRRTMEMITTRTRQIAHAVKYEQTAAFEKYIRTRKADRKRIAHDLASRHLEVLFGFLPLIGEVEGLCDQLSAESTAYITGRGRMRQIAESRTPGVTVQRNVPVNTGSNYLPARALVSKSYERNASSRTSLRYKLTIDATQQLRDNGFNPLATLYDLVPLSFLTDFVSNVGAWLRSHDPMFGTEYVTGSTMILYEDTDEWTVSGVDYVTSGNVTKTTMFGTLTQRGRYYRRVVHAEPPTAVMQWQNNLTPGKLATAAALIIQRYLTPLRPLLKAKQFRYRGPRPKFLKPILYRRP